MAIYNGKELIEDLDLEDELNKWDRADSEKSYRRPVKTAEIKKEINPDAAEKESSLKSNEADLSEKQGSKANTIIFRENKELGLVCGINSNGELFLGNGKSGYNLPDTSLNRERIIKDFEYYNKPLGQPEKSESKIISAAEDNEKGEPEPKSDDKDHSDMEILEKPAQVTVEVDEGPFKRLKDSFIGKVRPVKDRFYAKLYKYGFVDRSKEQINDLKKHMYDESYIASLKARSEADDVPAMNELGVVYFSLGDTKEAEKYFAKAAAVGNYIAQRNLAITMENNHSGKLEKIFGLYAEAAAEYDVIAINNLGCCHLNGEGTPQNYEKAVLCFKKAAEFKDDLAILNLATCCSFGIEKDLPKALELYKQAADLGNNNALKIIADSYYYGRGTKQDIKEALKYYRASAETGDEDSAKMAEKITKSQQRISEKQPVYKHRTAANEKPEESARTAEEGRRITENNKKTAEKNKKTKEHKSYDVER